MRKYANWNFLGLIVAMLFLGAKNPDELILKENLVLKQELLVRKQQMDYYEQEAQCYEQLLADLNSAPKSAPSKKRSSTKTNSSKVVGSVGVFDIYKRARFDRMDPVLIEAMTACSGPAGILVTSALRPHCKKSKHSKGKAIDLNWDSKGKEFATWLDSTEGKEWLSKYSLGYYLENIREKKGHSNYLYNPKATGPHIHLYII